MKVSQYNPSVNLIKTSSHSAIQTINATVELWQFLPMDTELGTEENESGSNDSCSDGTSTGWFCLKWSDDGIISWFIGALFKMLKWGDDILPGRLSLRWLSPLKLSAASIGWVFSMVDTWLLSGLEIGNTDHSFCLLITNRNGPVIFCLHC